MNNSGLRQKASFSGNKCAYHGGTRIRDGIRDEFSYGREPKVKRITMGDNQGITELILREF